MNTVRKPHRMARDPQPQSGEGAPIERNADVGSASDCANPSELKLARVAKQGLLIDMLGGDGGVSLTAIVEATGWLPYTARAALTGLRKKAHAIERFRDDEETRQRIVTASAAASVDAAHSSGDLYGARAGAGSDADADVDAGATA